MFKKLAVAAVAAYLLVQSFGAIVTYGQFVVAGAIAAIIAYGVVAVELHRKFVEARARDTTWESLADSIQVIRLEPLQFAQSADIETRYLGFTREEMLLRIALVDFFLSVGCVWLAPHPMGDTYWGFHETRQVSPLVSLAMSSVAAVAVSGLMLEVDDLHENYKAKAKADLDRPLTELRVVINRQLTEAYAQMFRLADSLRALGVEGTVLPATIEWTSALDVLRTLEHLRCHAERLRALGDNVEAHRLDVTRIRSRVRLLHRKLASAPPSTRACSARLGLDDASRSLEHLASFVASDPRQVALRELEELREVVDRLEWDVAEACRFETKPPPNTTRPSVDDPYTLLGVLRGARRSDIKEAYRRMAFEHHPDRGGDPALFRAVVAAYQTLTQPASA